REMRLPGGAFAASLDADSEGHEGKFYVWTPDEIDAVLGDEEGQIFQRYHSVVAKGNFEGSNVLSVPRDPAQIALELGIPASELRDRINQARSKLYEARSRRVWPGRDEKILTSWNAMMMRSLADGGAALQRPDLIEMAERNARFIRDHLYVDGRLLRSFKDGAARIDAYLEDYANLIDAVISLYEATFDPEWLGWARDLAKRMIDEFWDDGQNAFFDTAESGEALIARPRDVFDNATPSGNSVAAEALLRLALLTGEEDYGLRASEILEQYGAFAAEQPNGFGRLLCAYDFAVGDVREVAVVGAKSRPETQALLGVLREHYLPWKVVALSQPNVDGVDQVPLLTNRTEVAGKPAAYVCQNFVCQLPVTSPEELAGQLGIETE
ncbi:MAG: thioredoxin domain-containing protein, partial [Nitrolancea sp.]